MAGRSLGSWVQPARGLTGQQAGHVLLVMHGGTSSPPHPAGMVGQSQGEGPLVLQLCTDRVAVGSVRLGTYGERMDLRAGSVSPSFSHGRGTQAERYHLAQASPAGSSVLHEVSRCLGNALLSPVALEGALSPSATAQGQWVAP